MEKRKITLIDRLRDRGFVDQWGFLLFAIGGGLGIVAAKYTNAPAGWVTIGAIALMGIYALIISRSGSGRLRSDQAGDNCYYLGLIYTLSSLAYAIFFFDPANTATTIVQGFGIALATTVLGLVLRVFFNQGRPDLEDYEERARISLTQAAAELKTELGQIVITMKDFGLQVRQSINETRDAAASDINSFTRSSVDGLREVVETANEAIRAESNDFAARSKRYTTAFDRLLGTLESHTENVGKLSDAHETMLGTVGAISASAAGARDAVEHFATQSEDASTGLRAIRDSSENVQSMMERLQLTVTSIDGVVTQFHEHVTRQLDALKTGPGATVENAVEALADATAKLRGEIEELTATHRTAASGIASQAESALTVTRDHNVALEAALEQSRLNVSKVYDELVKMTGELARQVEGRR